MLPDRCHAPHSPLPCPPCPLALPALLARLQLPSLLKAAQRCLEPCCLASLSRSGRRCSPARCASSCWARVWGCMPAPGVSVHKGCNVFVDIGRLHESTNWAHMHMPSLTTPRLRLCLCLGGLHSIPGERDGGRAHRCGWRRVAGGHHLHAWLQEQPGGLK